MQSHLDIATNYVSVAHAYAALTADPREERRQLPASGNDMQDCLAMANTFAHVSGNYSVLTARDPEGQPAGGRPAEERSNGGRAEEHSRRRPGRRPGEEELAGLERPLPSQLHDPFSSAMADVADTYFTVTGMQGVSNSSFAVSSSYADIAAKLDALTSGMDVGESCAEVEEMRRRMAQADQATGASQPVRRASPKAASEVAQGALENAGASGERPEDLSVTGDTASVLEPEPDCEPMGAMGSTTGSLNFGSPR